MYVFTLFNSAMWLNSYCTLEAMFRFPVLGHLRRVESYAENERKTILLASYLYDFILFLVKNWKF